MEYKQSLLNKINAVEQEKLKTQNQLEELEKEFNNVKLNPYGITSIDFSKRQELSADLLKMEGSIMGLQLALETYDEANKTIS
jgi:hypothetical protein